MYEVVLVFKTRFLVSRRANKLIEYLYRTCLCVGVWAGVRGGGGGRL